MAYEKTIWKAREGSSLNRFEKEQESARSVILQNRPNSVTEPGTPFSVDNMNKIEQGISDAHELIEDERVKREQEDALINARIDSAGLNVIGVNEVPRDAIAYWSCDEVGIPDDPAGTVYRNDREWTGWTLGGTDAPVINNGVMINNLQASFNTVIYVTAGDLLIIRARQISGVLSTLVAMLNAGQNSWHNFLPDSLLTREWKIFLLRIPISGYLSAVYRNNMYTADGTLEISDLYIGNAAYLTPLLDNSGNGHHAPLTGGVIPTQGRFGRGLFLLSGLNCPVNASQVMTLSYWFNTQSQQITGPYKDRLLWSSNWTDNGFLVRQYSSYYFGILFFDAGINVFAIANINDSNWHNLTLIISSTQFTVWIDGKKQPTQQGNIRIPAAGIYPHFFDGMLVDEIAVFSRALTDRECDALYMTTLPKFYTMANWLLDPLNPTNALQEDGRYRGFTSSADTTNTGIINGIRMNHRDWILFKGNSFWTQNYIYEWDAVKSLWTRLERPGNWEKYLDAVSDITTGATEGVYSTAFIKNLFAQTLNAEVANILFKLCVGSGNNGIEINGSDGSIKSGNYRSSNQNNPAGFILKKEKGADGIQAEFTDIKTKNMQAVDANVTGGISAGGVWNIDGSDKNPNNQGGLWIPGYSTRGRFKDFDLMGQLLFGPSGKTAAVVFSRGYVQRQPQVPHYLHQQFHIHGNYTLTSLNTAILNATGAQPGTGYFFPISGKILLQTGTSGGSPIYERIWISGARSGTSLTLYGIGENSNTLRTISLNGTTNVIASIAII